MKLKTSKDKELFKQLTYHFELMEKLKPGYNQRFQLWSDNLLKKAKSIYE